MENSGRRGTEFSQLLGKHQCTPLGKLYPFCHKRIDPRLEVFIYRVHKKRKLWNLEKIYFVLIVN